MYEHGFRAEREDRQSYVVQMAKLTMLFGISLQHLVSLHSLGAHYISCKLKLKLI